MAAWLPLLSLGLLPLELLLLQLILAASDPGPAPKLEILLLWAIAILLPQILSGLNKLLLFSTALIQLPILIWFDQRAGSFNELTPWQGQSRIESLLWAFALLLLIQWQFRPLLRFAIAIKPNQNSTEQQSSHLDAEISEGDQTTAGTTHSHGGGSNGGGGEKGKPEGPAQASPGGASLLK